MAVQCLERTHLGRGPMLILDEAPERKVYPGSQPPYHKAKLRRSLLEVGGFSSINLHEWAHEDMLRVHLAWSQVDNSKSVKAGKTFTEMGRSCNLQYTVYQCIIGHPDMSCHCMQSTHWITTLSTASNYGNEERKAAQRALHLRLPA